MTRITHTFTPLPLLALMALGTACDGVAREPVTHHDSAGVSIMMSHSPEWSQSERWQVAADPALSLGGITGQRAYSFTNVGDAQILADGRILVTHCSSPPEVRLYRGDGAFIRAFGGDGSDPGRCRFVLRSWLVGSDTLIVHDPTLGRITRYDIHGAVLDARPLPTGDEAPVWLHRLADGRLVGRPNNPQPTTEGRSRATFTYSLLHPGTLQIEPLVDAAGAEFVVTGDGAQRRVDQVLFAAFTAAASRGASIYLSDTRDFWIDEVDTDGRLIRRFGRDWASERIDRRFVREYTDQRLAAAGPAVRTMRQELGRAVFADHLPAHEQTMLVDGSDHLWVLHLPDRRRDERVWSVFAPDGRWLGELTTPRRLRVTGIGEDRLIGVWQEGDGQMVRVYELLKPELQ